MILIQDCVRYIIDQPRILCRFELLILLIGMAAIGVWCFSNVWCRCFLFIATRGCGSYCHEYGGCGLSSTVSVSFVPPPPPPRKPFFVIFCHFFRHSMNRSSILILSIQPQAAPSQHRAHHGRDVCSPGSPHHP